MNEKKFTTAQEAITAPGTPDSTYTIDTAAVIIRSCAKVANESRIEAAQAFERFANAAADLRSLLNSPDFYTTEHSATTIDTTMTRIAAFVKAAAAERKAAQTADTCRAITYQAIDIYNSLFPGHFNLAFCWDTPEQVTLFTEVRYDGKTVVTI